MSINTLSYSTLILAIACNSCGDEHPKTAKEQVVSVVEVSAGQRRTCALDRDGVVWCWGVDSEGGRPPFPDDYVPKKELPLVGGFSSLDARMDDACAIATSSDLICAYLGNVMNISTGVVAYDQAVNYITDPRRPSPSGIDCFVKGGGAVFCGLTEGSFSLVETEPSVDIAVGAEHACSLGVDRLVRCWGGGVIGDGVDRRAKAFGDMLVARQDVPTVIASLGTDVVEIEAGGHTTCARTTDGSVFCWGLVRGDFGDSRDLALTPTKVFMPRAATIAVGLEAACAVSVDGAVWCWGANFQARPYLRDRTSKPFEVLGLPAVKSVSVGVAHACAVSQGGDLWCWGQNETGQLGRTNTSRAPMQVKGWGAVSLPR